MNDVYVRLDLAIEAVEHHFNKADALRALPRLTLPAISVTDGIVEDAVKAFASASKDDGKTIPIAEGIRAALEAALGATVSDGWEDMREALTLARAALTAPTIGTVDMDDPDWYAEVDKAVKAIDSALGPLPAPPSE